MVKNEAPVNNSKSNWTKRENPHTGNVDNDYPYGN